MLAIDIAIAVGCVALTVFGIGVAMRMRQQAKERDKATALREQGKKNAREVELEAQLICAECDKPINPTTDVFIGDTSKGSWWHRACYRQIAS